MLEGWAGMCREEAFTNYYTTEEGFHSGNAESSERKLSAYFFRWATFFPAGAMLFLAAVLPGNTRAKILSMFFNCRFRSNACSIFAFGTRPRISGSFKINSWKSRFSFHA